MDTWVLLGKELDYYGINLIDSKKCQIHNANGELKTQGVIKTIRLLRKQIKKQKKLLLSLWNELIEILQSESFSSEIIDDKILNLFVFSINSKSFNSSAVF